MKPSEKINFAISLTKAVDAVRVARREVKELNSKIDPEKELYCYSAIFKAEAQIERCNIIIKRDEKRQNIRSVKNDS